MYLIFITSTLVAFFAWGYVTAFERGNSYGYGEAVDHALHTCQRGAVLFKDGENVYHCGRIQDL